MRYLCNVCYCLGDIGKSSTETEQLPASLASNTKSYQMEFNKKLRTPWYSKWRYFENLNKYQNRYDYQDWKNNLLLEPNAKLLSLSSCNLVPQGSDGPFLHTSRRLNLMSFKRCCANQVSQAKPSH